ncbi:hypothetical protein I6N91_03175 [Arthrobacter sp. MSA 4-2]|uniref:HGGxSTG domain-containing protein n=1 Tax=Arthrobacter sp. MSA 4-2 TaxID=2794349 RepID=UPI0018E7F8F9|nr:HGGxSTG domain-containing protein [Arthrobacter sp. MSA 4-2]MBJ2119976.1 hypothetical protein [Arthrobacter sp. MSA 4-2]
MAECGAKKKSEESCGAPAMKGQRRCARHGGKSPQAQRAATARLAEQDAKATMEKAVTTLGLPVDIDPAKTLLDEISRTRGARLWLRDKVREIQPDELV